MSSVMGYAIQGQGHAEVARLTESLDAAHAKELAATFKTLAPTVHIAPAETVSNEPMTAKALAAAMALPAEKTFDDKLKGRTDWLGVRIEHALSAAKGLDSKNVVVRLQAESDATQKVADAFDGGGFDTVDVRRVYLSGGDYYAALAVPAGCAPVEYCMVVQALTGYKLRCIPASTGGVVVNVNAASLDLTDWSPAAKAAALAALKPYGTSRA